MKLTKQPSESQHFVAIDLGSNSFHLIIVRERNNQVEVIYKQKQSIKLALGLENDNVIDDKSLSLAMHCLESFARSFAHLSNCHVAIVATYALRQAHNSEQFIQQASRVMPHPITIISGEYEAELIYYGVAYTNSINEPTLIIDIGGGSTELIIGQHLAPKLTQSLHMGCVSFSQKFFRSGAINDINMEETENYSKQILYAVAGQYHLLGWGKALGTSGSIKAITQIMKAQYGDSKITLCRLKQLKYQLISWGHHDNISLPDLSDKRRPLLAAAVAILLACVDVLNIQNLKYNAGGVREGLLYQLRNQRHN